MGQTTGFVADHGLSDKLLKISCPQCSILYGFYVRHKNLSKTLP